MPSGTPIQSGEIMLMIDTFSAARKQGMNVKRACEYTARTVTGPEGEIRHWKVIWQTIQRYRPTGRMARIYFQSRALKMARRVVEKGTTAELIDVLSRPNIGVLSPKQATGGDSNGPLFLAISADSCGAVKAVAGHGAVPFKGLPAADTADTEENWYEPTGSAESTGPAEALDAESEGAEAEDLRAKARRAVEAKRGTLKRRANA